MDKSSDAGKRFARFEEFLVFELQRRKFAGYGEWFVNVSTRGRSKVYEAYPASGPRKTEVLPCGGVWR